MGFKCGIVGLPNVGKSTLFNALTQAGIAASNYPFCTIEPNTGVVPVPDTRLDAIASIAKSAKVLPTTMEFIDIAGLVAGAAQGEGLGNQFLAHVRETDAIAHVVRCFEDDDITHVAGQVNPQQDIATINTELCLADLERVEKALQKTTKLAKSGDKQAKQDQSLLEQAQQHLNQTQPLRTLPQAIQDALQTFHFITLKPTLYIANVAENGLHNNPLCDQVLEITKQENAPLVAVCAAIESEIAELDASDKQAFLDDLGLTEPGLNRLIHSGYNLLNLHTYFTAGPKEARAWTIPMGANAPQAAGKIHTDFEKGFIRAEVISYEDYTEHQGEAGAKAAGKWRLEGKDYIVQDGDVVFFRFNT